MTVEIDETMTLVFTNKSKDRYYVHGKLEGSDVPPGPVRLSGINLEQCEDKFFLFWIADCMCPPMYVINARSFEQAYEEFIDWRVEQLKIDDADLPKTGQQLWESQKGELLKDWTWDMLGENAKHKWNQKAEESDEWQSMSYSGKGVPVDTEAIGGEEIDLLLTLSESSDKTLWNIAAIFLSRVTRYENEYDAGDEFRREMSKCCTQPGTVNPHTMPAVIEVWKHAKNVSNHGF